MSNLPYNFNLRDWIQKAEDKFCCMGTYMDSPVMMSYNGTTGELTLTDQNGLETIINLPLEQFLSGASYNDTTNILTLTMSDTTTFDVNLSDLVDGLVVPGGSNTQIQYNNAGAFAGSSQLVANIGATNTLDITGSGSTSATNALRVRNLSATNLLTIANDGLFTIGGTRDLSTNSDNVFNYNGNYTLNSGITAFNTNSVFRFAPTITSNLATARPVSFAITPTWASISDTRVAMYLSNTSVAPSTIGVNSSLFISNTGTSQTGAFIRMGSSASTTGLSIDQTAVPILINDVNTNGTAINIQPSGASNIHYPLVDFQSVAVNIGLPMILNSRNTTAGNSSIYSALSLQNTSTASSGSALGINAGVGIDFVIQNATGAIARTATIQALTPDQSTLSNVIDLRMQTVDNTGTANTTLISKGATGYLGVNTATPLAGVHDAINTTASTPSMLLSGTGYAGGTNTTTKPTLLIEPTGTTSTGWSTSGTKLGVNAESGFTGNLLDLQVNGVSYMSVSGDGTFTARGRNTTGWASTYILGTNSTDAVINGYANNTLQIYDKSTSTQEDKPNAILNVTSTSKGFLPPRMTTAQRNAVTWVAGDAGMMIFNRDLVKLQVWNGTAWETVTSV